MRRALAVVWAVGAAGIILITAGPAVAQVTLLGAQYRPDQAFPEHECFWHESQFPGPCGPSSPLGASLHVFLRNNGASAVSVSDVTISGMSLTQSLVIQEQVVKRHPASIYFATLTSAQLQTLLAAGEPVWWKADPATIAPGATTQIVVRLRQVPQISSVSIGVAHSQGTVSTSIPVAADQPRVAGASFSSDLMKVYLYWRRTTAGLAPTTILMDGTNVTSSASIVVDPGLGTSVAVLSFANPLSRGSFHVFQGTYADGKTVGCGLRAWPNEFIYGMWGAWPAADGDTTTARNYITDATNHLINTQVQTLGSAGVQSYIKTAEGAQYCADRGLGFVIDAIQKWGVLNPAMWFIRDEPDAADSLVTGLANDKMVGSLAQSCALQADVLRAGDPTVPTALNLDLTYKPFNWYNYGQVPDVVMSDPYYQPRLREAYWSNPQRIPLYSKATFVYAVSQLAQSSAEPNPLHIILYSCEYVDANAPFPFPTPESKRIEVYYALAAGAKGLSYWWFIPGSPANGVGDGPVNGDTAGAALWKEIGLLGAEVRTAGPVLVTSCPAALNVSATSGLWVRSLLSGTDTIVLLCVNDQYSNDQTGCHYTPLTSASVTLNLPSWMSSPSAFEINAGGVQNVTAQQVGNQLQVTLGTVNLTRMIVVTKNSDLRSTLQQRFNDQYRTKVCALSPSLCTVNPPAISQQPLSRSVSLGGNTTFSITASGTAPLTYAWQKNHVNLAEASPFSGVATPTLTITGARSTDAGNYRCVVTNTAGTAISSEVTLSVLSPDFDHDGDVDLVDFSHLQLCLGLIDVATAPLCADTDLSGDAHVNSTDLTKFLGCMAGSDVPIVINCMN